jgi:hypothetical protein
MLAEETQSALNEPVPALITTSLGAGLESCRELIVHIAERRAVVAAATTFVACENNPGETYQRLETELSALGVECRPTMVNRLCPARYLDDEPRLFARADPYAEWLIQGDPDNGVLRMLGSVTYVDFVDDVVPFATRKRWLCNGVHLALGIFAREVNETSIRKIALDPERRSQVDELQDDMVQALAEKSNGVLGDSNRYARDQLVPMCRTEDETNRILKRLRRAKLAPFIEDAQRKIGEPAREFLRESADGELASSFEDVFDALHHVLLNIDLYEDAVCVRQGRVALSEVEDKAALDAYERLLDGIFDEVTKRKKCDQLLRRLRRHHLVAGGDSPGIAPDPPPSGEEGPGQPPP